MDQTWVLGISRQLVGRHRSYINHLCPVPSASGIRCRDEVYSCWLLGKYMIETVDWESSWPRSIPPKSSITPRREESGQDAFELPTVLCEIEVTNGNMRFAVEP